MKKIYFILALLCAPLCVLQAQAYLASKTKLDNLKPYKIQGDAALSLKVEQTDKLKLELDAAAELILPTKHHKFRLAGNTAYNYKNFYDNGNRGYAVLGADLFQFNISEQERKKNLCFLELNAAVEYDYCRFLDLRTLVSAAVTFQPLRNSKHWCLEPSLGVMGDFKKWDILSGDNRNLLREVYTNQLTQAQRDYLGINTNTWERWQMAPDVYASINVLGEWSHTAFNCMFLVSQPVMSPFKQDEAIEATLPDCFKGLYNTKMLPQFSLDMNFKIRIIEHLSFLMHGELTHDLGQLSRQYADNVVINGIETGNTIGARDHRFCFTFGLMASW